MSVKYSWSRQNGAAVPPVRFMSIEPAEDYYKGMPLKLKEKGIVEPTDGDPEYICMAQYDPDAEIQPLEIPVQEVFPDVIYEKINNDGTTEEVRFGSRGGGVGIKTVNGQKPDANGNVEVTAGVQSDMYETDPESMAFVKNNPIESGVVELAFDGTLEGKEYKEISMEGMTGYVVKMSDNVPPVEDLISCKLNTGEGETVVELTEENVLFDDGGYSVNGVFILGVFQDETYHDEWGLTFSKGIWFTLVDASIMGGTGWMGGLGLTYKAKKVKSSLIPTHKHKWDDISDAPFYDKSVSAPLNITWDGDLTGRENFPAGAEDSYMVKVSDVVLSMEQLVGSTISYLSETGNQTLEITEDLIFDATSQGMPMYSVDANLVIIVLEDIYQEGMSITKGVWFSTFGNGAAYTKSISSPNATITTSEIKKLDPKFYERPCYDDRVTNAKSYSYDGVLDNKTTVELAIGEYLVKVSDDIIVSANSFVGASLLGSYSSDPQIITEDVIAVNDDYIAVGEKTVVSVINDCVFNGVAITKGLWVYHSMMGYISSLSNVTITTGEIKKLDNKYIDAEWMAKGGQEQFKGEIVSNQTVQSASIGGGSNLIGYASNYDLIKEGDGLRVVWNGKDYNVTVKAATISAYGYTINVLYAGNYGAVLSNQGMESPVAATGEPFSITFGQTNIQTGEFERVLDASVATEEATGVENTISIYAESSIVPLPEKFMPELTQVVLISPSGKKFKTTVGDDGVLITTEV